MRSFISMTSILFFAFAAQPSYAQEQSASYVSQTDQDLNIRRVTILPVTDNTDGIYARPAETQLIQQIRDSHRWDYVEGNLGSTNPIPTLIELEESPAQVQKLLAKVDADAAIGAALSKGPNGLSLRVDLFLKKDGKVLIQEVVRDLPRFELAEVRSQITQIYKRVVAKVPYDGMILSRQQNRVTINLGKSDGLLKDQVVTAVQILGVNRHPKFNFLVSTEKEILGRIKILKVDETLSFGSIISEKERGAIQRLAKIAGLSQVSYGDPASITDPSVNDIGNRPDSPVSFGKTPREWLPTQPPSFGLVGARLGFGSYSSSAAVSSGSLEAKSLFYPRLALYGEMWITSEWLIRADVTQGIINTSNPRAGSTPAELNHLMNRYSMEVGYNFLLHNDDFFGPKLNLSAGFMTYRMFVDDSTPTGLTTANYSGMLLGLGGSFPITEEKIWFAGGRLNLFVFTSLNESPKTSGDSSKNNINDFSLFVERKIAENMRLTGSLDFSLYSSSFSGQGTRDNGETAASLSQRHTVLSGGLVYMF
jgi:hypothetical protein